MRLIKGDAFEILQTLEPGSVDLVLTDPPYGVTRNEWDKLPPLSELWELLYRITKPTAAFVFTASQPFTSQLVMSNLKDFRHEWIWQKTTGSNFLNAKREPMKEHESVLVFSRGKWTYNPQRQGRKPSGWSKTPHEKMASYDQGSTNYNVLKGRREPQRDESRLPSSVQKFKNERGLHPTQKPETLMRYLVATYSSHGELVLDPFMGSCSTGAAALSIHRQFIGIEKDPKYFEIADQRLQNVQLRLA